MAARCKRVLFLDPVEGAEELARSMSMLGFECEVIPAWPPAGAWAADIIVGALPPANGGGRAAPPPEIGVPWIAVLREKQVDAVLAAFREGAADVLVSPVSTADLVAAVHRRTRPVRPTAPTGTDRTLAEVERDHVLAVLQAVGGSRQRASRILGVDRKTLYRKLARYGPEATSAVTPHAPAVSSKRTQKELTDG